MEYYWWALVLLLPVLYLLFRRPSNKPKRQILFYGPCDSGKTYLFYLLTSNSAEETVSSMKVNQGEILIPDIGKVSIKDIPGHQIFLTDLASSLPDSQGVVFLVDSSDKSTFKDAAKLLDDLLTTAMIAGKPLSLLIFCNKQDKPFSKKSLMVESELSTEIERLRKSKKALAEDEEVVDFGRVGERFDFDHCKDFGTTVTFGEGSLKVNAEIVASFISSVYGTKA
mmetsp:Transcript_1061/g.2597  ORF Transcript_1061/g.2597 Transcript_1061/m.2597 type:complete len:225 (+) Transcript_1061:2334-3008(+)